MTLEDMQTEIENLRREQELQRKHWRRWGLAANIAGLVLALAVLLRAALTASELPSSMLFIVLTLLFVGLAFTSAGRGYNSPDRSPPAAIRRTGLPVPNFVRRPPNSGWLEPLTHASAQASPALIA